MACLFACFGVWILHPIVRSRTSNIGFQVDVLGAKRIAKERQNAGEGGRFPGGTEKRELEPAERPRRYQPRPLKVPAPRARGSARKLPRRDVPRRYPVGRRRFRGAACRIRRHRDGDHVGILVHRARGGIYPKSDDAAEDHIAGSHAFGVRRNDARSEQIAFLRALDRKRARPPGKGHRSWGRDYLRPALGLNSAACPRRARGINGDIASCPW